MNNVNLFDILIVLKHFLFPGVKLIKNPRCLMWSQMVLDLTVIVIYALICMRMYQAHLLINAWIHVRIINCRFMAMIFNVLILMRPTSITAYQLTFYIPSFCNIAFRFSMLKLFYVDDWRNICWVNLKSNQSRQCWQICWSVSILMQPMHYLSRNRTASLCEPDAFLMVHWLCFKLILMSSDQCKTLLHGCSVCTLGGA